LQQILYITSYTRWESERAREQERERETERERQRQTARAINNELPSSLHYPPNYTVQRTYITKCSVQSSLYRVRCTVNTATGYISYYDSSVIYTNLNINEEYNNGEQDASERASTQDAIDT